MFIIKNDCIRTSFAVCYEAVLLLASLADKNICKILKIKFNEKRMCNRMQVKYKLELSLFSIDSTIRNINFRGVNSI